jgi:hypothetical protein
MFAGAWKWRKESSPLWCTRNRKVTFSDTFTWAAGLLMRFVVLQSPSALSYLLEELRERTWSLSFGELPNTRQEYRPVKSEVYKSKTWWASRPSVVMFHIWGYLMDCDWNSYWMLTPILLWALVLDHEDPILPLLYVEHTSVIIIFLYKRPIKLIRLYDISYSSH